MPETPRVIICPACRTRVPLDPFETSVTCPSCGDAISPGDAAPSPLLTLPSERGQDLVVGTPLSDEKEQWEPQIPAPREASFHDPLKSTEELRSSDRRRRKRKTKRTKAMGWDAKTKKRGGLQRLHWATLGVAAALVVVLGAALAIKVLFFQHAPTVPVARVDPSALDADGREAGGLTEEDGRLALETIQRFLTAPSLEDMARVVREPARVEPLMRDFYGEAGWRPMLVRHLPDHKTFQTNGDLVAAEIEIDDYQRKLIALQRAGDGFKVDWEAFVGWCEVPWAELAARRPTQSFLMRVKLTPDDYYNFDFQNPNDWACYRLVSADGEHSIYGYVRRNRPLHQELQAKLGGAPLILPTLRVSFRDSGASRNQVQIDTFVANGWVLNSEATSPRPPAPPPADTTPDPAPTPEPELKTEN